MLNNSPHYWGHIKAAITAFGRMFSGIQIVRRHPTDSTKNQTLEIPISYAPKEKWLVRVEQEPELESRVHTILPRMGFEILGYNYDPTRKLARMEKLINGNALSNVTLESSTTDSSTIVTSDGLFANVLVGTNVVGAGIPANAKVVSKESNSSLTISVPATATGTVNLQYQYRTVKQVYTPVPYNINIALYIITKTQEDNLQIVEQILPVFTPEYTVSVNMMPDLQLQNDVPIVLDSIQVQDDYDGDFQTRRFVTTTLSFTLKINLYGGTSNAGIITKTFTKFNPVANVNDPAGASEIAVSEGTVPGGQVIDSWLEEF